MHDMPNDIDAERATLGSILLNADVVIALAPWFAATFFYLEKHTWIYQAMLDCYHQHTMPSVRIVADRLADRQQLDAIGGLAYLLHLDDGLPHGLDAEVYARRVEYCAIRRGLMGAASKIAVLADRELDGPQALADAQAEIARVAALRSSCTSFVPFSSIVDEVYDDLASDRLPGITTGYRDLDELTGGFHPGDLMILAARPGVGKSSLAGCLACNIASEHKMPVGFISLEMGRKDILSRAAALYAGLDLAAIRDRRLNDEQRTAFMSALQWAHDQPVFVNDEPRQTTTAIRSHVLRLAAEHGDLGLLIVDYLQLMRGNGKKERWLEIGEFSAELKQLAREVGVPILALSQLSRAVEGRTSHIPILSDLRESGNLEQDADIVMFIYRPELYDKDTDKKGVAELHIAKHRNGALGVVPLRFDPTCTRFDTLTWRTPDGY
jgi:replicative DNA helicase